MCLLDVAALSSDDEAIFHTGCANFDSIAFRIVDLPDPDALRKMSEEKSMLRAAFSLSMK